MKILTVLLCLIAVSCRATNTDDFRAVTVLVHPAALSNEPVQLLQAQTLVKGTNLGLTLTYGGSYPPGSAGGSSISNVNVLDANYVNSGVLSGGTLNVQNIAPLLSGVINLDGTVNAGGYAITNLSGPSNPNDAATKNYVDSGFTNFSIASLPYMTVGYATSAGTATTANYATTAGTSISTSSVAFIRLLATNNTQSAVAGSYSNVAWQVVDTNSNSSVFSTDMTNATVLTSGLYEYSAKVVIYNAAQGEVDAQITTNGFANASHGVGYASTYNMGLYTTLTRTDKIWLPANTPVKISWRPGCPGGGWLNGQTASLPSFVTSLTLTYISQ